MSKINFHFGVKYVGTSLVFLAWKLFFRFLFPIPNVRWQFRKLKISFHNKISTCVGVWEASILNVFCCNNSILAGVQVVLAFQRQLLTHSAIQQHFAFEMSNNEIPHFAFAHLRCHAHFVPTNQKFCVGKMEKLSHVQNLLFYYVFSTNSPTHLPHDFHVRFCNVGVFISRLSPGYFRCAGTLYSICFGNSLAQVLLNNKVDLHDVHKGKWQRAFLFLYYCYSMQIATNFLRRI